MSPTELASFRKALRRPKNSKLVHDTIAHHRQRAERAEAKLSKARALSIAIVVAGYALVMVAMFTQIPKWLSLGDPTSRSGKEWVDLARDAPLQPCFGSPADVQLAATLFEADQALPRETGGDDASANQIIPSGPFEGMVIPKHCFAVQTGYYGFATEFWLRPRNPDNSVNYDIPYWNPPS